MQQTLFVIPAWLFDGPLIIAWAIGGIIALAYLLYKHGWGHQVISFLPIFLIMGAVIYFVLPNVVIDGTDPENPNGPPVPWGLAVRGYGMMMLLAMVSGFVLVVVRANQCRLNTERIVSLSFWMILCGIIGARLFFVIQKSDQFEANNLREMIVSMVDMTKGGLVVYGSFIGSMLAAAVFCWRTKIRFWITADILVPALLLGLAIGRVGCLLNGCCFGGACEVQWAAAKFPAGSPPYMRHLATGELLGMKTSPHETEPGSYVVESVEPGSLAEEFSFQPGEIFRVNSGPERIIRDRIAHGIPIQSQIEVYSNRIPQRIIDLSRFENSPLNQSLPIHPTQVYSAVNAFLLAMIAWFMFPFRWRDGDVMGVMLILYAITRFLLEYVRTDEIPIDPWGLLTVSQWVSVTMIVLGVGILLLQRMRPVARFAEAGE